MRHPEYHGISLGFWHAVDACGLDYIRDLDSDEIANVILKVGRLLKDRKFRKFLMDVSRSWLREERNFLGKPVCRRVRNIKIRGFCKGGCFKFASARS